MLRRIRFEPILALNLLRRNGTLLYDSVRYDRRHRTVEGIEDSVLDALQTRAEFLDSILQQVRLRPPQFMPQFRQPFHPQEALRLYLNRLIIEPFQEWA